MKKIFSAIAVLTAFATAAVSCSDDDTKDDEKIPVAEVKVTPATGSVVAGTTLTLKAEILPENASDKTVEWRSRTPEIATVDPETGVVTGVTEGEAEILALCGGKNGKAVITVKAKDQSAYVGEEQYHLIDMASELGRPALAAQFMALLGGNPLPRKKWEIPYQDFEALLASL